ncbi:hypothetical protein CRG98_012572 [Punica granatum]|uniref:Uncharacterized protein n=1 Tax=Punica granatum TaxID=22663 RepID=A0A2I0KEV5_PUNGR|nr:hypothetical protein CRG98_012572 [Punica granatum]
MDSSWVPGALVGAQEPHFEQAFGDLQLRWPDIGYSRNVVILISFEHLVITSGIKAQVLELLKISSTRFEVEKFNGMNDFELRQIEMKALLVKHSLEGALGGKSKLPTTLSLDEKIVMVLTNVDINIKYIAAEYSIGVL